MRSLVCLLALAGCVDAADLGAPDTQNLLDGDDKADGSDPLWAGLTSITIERYAADPCNDGQRAFGDEPVIYDDWARQRASVRNICFEVWKPGVTDWDNPDFWKQLDVQVHYRYSSTGAFRDAYVDSNGRRGNNRRYAWSLAYQVDPTVNAATIAQVNAPFRILSESNGWAMIEADMEVYFTVNGRALKTPSSKPYVVRYQGYVRMPALAPNANGYVLHDIVKCEGGAVRFGSGAGYFAADMNHAKAAALVDANLIYGVGVAHVGQMVQTTYSSQITVAGQTLPGFVEESGGLRITPNGTQMTVEIDAYDRVAQAKRTVSTTFDNCVL
jgi:hypothetical protein